MAATKKVLVRIDADGSEKRVPYKGQPKYEVLRDLVGGTIQPVRVRYDDKVRNAYVDDEGLLKQLPLNRRATGLSWEFGYGDLHGPIVILTTEA